VYRILALIAAVLLLAPHAYCQEDAVVFMNALTPLGVGPARETPAGYTPGGFLVQGVRNEFVVINRKFLTEYSINIDGVTTLQNFAIQDLDEAANLTTPFPTATSSATKGAAPKGGAAAGNLSSRTAQQMLVLLLNPETSSQPITDLNSDWVTLNHEADRVEADRVAFNAAATLLLGNAAGPMVPQPVPPAPVAPPTTVTAAVHAACGQAQSAPSIYGAEQCLYRIFQLEYSSHFPLGGSYGDEQAFRDLLVTDNDAIAMVTNLAGSLPAQVQGLNNLITSFDADAAQYRADWNVFAGNMQAATDTLLLFNDLADTQITEIRARLAQALNPSGTTIVDAAELNELAEEYYRAAHTPGGVSRIARDRLGALLEGFARGARNLPQSQAAPPDPPIAPGNAVMYARATAAIGSFYANQVTAGYTEMNATVLARIQDVNILQSQVLARANEIYDRSAVPVPVRKQFNLAGNPGNLLVYFTVRETETFPRFAVPPLTPQGQAAVTTVPPAAPATSPPASATPPSGTASPANTSTGVIVAHGEVQVHDLYKATMVAGFGFSGVGETTFSTSVITNGPAADGSTCSSTAPCEKIKVTRGANHTTPLVGFSFHPMGYDTYPHYKQPFWSRWGIMGGSSVLNINDYYAGLDLQVYTGIQVMVGGNFYRQSVLAPNYTDGGIYPGSSITFGGPQHWTIGPFGGIGLNLAIFRKAFGSVTGIGVGTASKGS
jgi:hypothetical protein